MQSLDSLGIGSQSGESRHDFPHAGISDVDLLMANGASIIAKALMGQIHKELSSNGSAMSKLQKTCEDGVETGAIAFEDREPLFWVILPAYLSLYDLPNP